MKLKLSAAALALAGITLMASMSTPTYAADARPLISALENSQGEPSLAPMLKEVIPAVAQRNSALCSRSSTVSASVSSAP